MESRLRRVLGAVARQGVSVFSAIQQNVWMRGALALAGCFCAVRASLILTLLHVAKRLMGTALIIQSMESFAFGLLIHGYKVAIWFDCGG